MKPLDHYRATLTEYDQPAWWWARLTAVCSVLPDAGVGMQRLPWPAARRWGALLHHSEPMMRLLGHWPVIGDGWTSHYHQDAATHPAGFYGEPEAVAVPPADELVLAYSGGPDSFITWRLLGQPRGVYLDVGNESARAEMTLVGAANATFAPAADWITKVTAPTLAELPTGWIPNRNLSIILACYQVGPNIVLARIAEWGPDKNPAFFRRVQRLVNTSKGGHFQAAADVPRLRIWTPVGHLTKTGLVRRYLDMVGRDQGAYDLTTYTRSCYRDQGDMFCGECGGCFCRWVAFENNDIDERDRYTVVPRRLDYYRRLDWRDFRAGMIPMYVKRHREMRGFE